MRRLPIHANFPGATRHFFGMNRFLVATIFLACQGAIHKQTQELGGLVRKYFDSTGSPIAELDVGLYTKFVLEKPKEYDFIVIYSANEHLCPICKPAEESFKRVAISYWMAGKSEIREDRVPVFFGLVDLGKHTEIAQMHRMSRAPNLHRYYKSEFDGARSVTGEIQPSSRKFMWSKPEMPVDELLEWMNSETNSQVEVYFSTGEKVGRILMGLTLIASAVVLVVRLVVSCRRNSVLIAIVALGIHFIATSGIFYNIIHGMQWAGTDQKGESQFLMPTARGQFLGEGLVMSGLVVSSGVSLFTAARLPYTEYARKADPNKLTYLLLGLVGVAAFCVSTVISSYVSKMGWYSEATMFPPPWYRSGPLRVDQGNTF